METSQIDELLVRYSHAEDRIAANLVELDDHPTYGLMTSGVYAVLSGIFPMQRILATSLLGIVLIVLFVFSYLKAGVERS